MCVCASVRACLCVQFSRMFVMMFILLRLYLQRESRDWLSTICRDQCPSVHQTEWDGGRVFVAITESRGWFSEGEVSTCSYEINILI